MPPFSTNPTFCQGNLLKADPQSASRMEGATIESRATCRAMSATSSQRVGRLGSGHYSEDSLMSKLSGDIAEIRLAEAWEKIFSQAPMAQQIIHVLSSEEHTSEL